MRARGPDGGQLVGDAREGGSQPSPAPAPALGVDKEAGVGGHGLHLPINAAQSGRKELQIAWTRI